MKVWLVVSDAHKGSQAAVKTCLLGSKWQRCKVHFMRNLMAHAVRSMFPMPHHEKKRFSEKLKQVWLQPNLESARHYAAGFVEEYELRFPEAIECLLEGLEDSL